MNRVTKAVLVSGCSPGSLDIRRMGLACGKYRFNKLDFGSIDADIEQKIADREEARKQKNWKRADEIRDVQRRLQDGVELGHGDLRSTVQASRSAGNSARDHHQQGL